MKIAKLFLLFLLPAVMLHAANPAALEIAKPEAGKNGLTKKALPDQHSHPPIRVKGDVMQSQLIHEVKPVYPALAIEYGISGLVMLEVIVGVDGRVENVRFLRGHPLLNNAAEEAVRQWVYKPVLVNDKPVRVSTVVTVQFILKGSN